MTNSPLTNSVYLTSDSSPRARGIDRFIIHHAATTSLAAILYLFQPGGRQVSANYALGSDGSLVLTVDEDRRAWTSGSAEWDGRSVTIEVANSYAGDPWPVSDAAFDKLARLIADVATRYGFPINDDTVLTHQELYIRYGDSYITACPGDMQRRKAELLELARNYQNGFLMALNENEQIELITKTRAIYDALFKNDPVQRPGRNATPGGVLVNQSIELDALFQKEGVNGAVRDGIFESLRKIQEKLDNKEVD